MFYVFSVFQDYYMFFLKALKCSQQFKDSGIGKDTGSSGLFRGYL